MNNTAQNLFLIIVALLILVWLPIAAVVWIRAIRQDIRERREGSHSERSEESNNK